jgi:hypothetical protein
MPISVHDNFIVSYEVRCEAREIRLHTEYRDRDPFEYTDVIFSGVEAYYFEGDNFCNIVMDINEGSVSNILTKNAAMFDNGKKYRWPGSWNTSSEAARVYLAERKVRAYLIYSSYGMGGWVLAKNMEMILKSS